MLQQTQVETVRTRYYPPFLQRFPTVAALADASEEEVLKAWQGLGYYSRARNLHKAAQLTSPKLPQDVPGLLALPGIGRNTAHAIAAFAYRHPVAVMEANVRRVLHRLLAQPAMREEECWDAAHALLDPAHPFEHNQAMMDIGALICTPTAPRCGECPLSYRCAGKENPLAYPAKKLKKPVPRRNVTILVPQSLSGKLYLTPRSSQFLGGLYAFPEFPSTSLTSLMIQWKSRDIRLSDLKMLGGVTHTYSHFKVEAEVYLLPGVAARGKGWYSEAQVAALPLSRVEEKIMRLLAPA